MRSSEKYVRIIYTNSLTTVEYVKLKNALKISINFKSTQSKKTSVMAKLKKHGHRTPKVCSSN